MKFVRRARGASFVLAAGWAAIVVVAVIIAWIALFILFLPFLLLSEVLGWRRRQARKVSESDALTRAQASPAGPSMAPDSQLIFDRRSDVSKLFGCNTRNVEYRWDLFANRLNEIKSKITEPKALDFGAGSLRDSYELIRQGFDVTSMDLDAEIMQRYFDSYDWSSVASTPRLFVDSIDKLSEIVGRDYFHLSISFDVIEHLERPEEYLKNLQPLLCDDGYLFAIVPNRRSIHERYFKRSMKKLRQSGLTWTPGVPHLQFRSPEEWEQFFESHGFTIVEHDMAIGPLVNDLWQGILGLPIRLYVAPAFHRIANILHRPFNPAKFEEGFFPAWLMASADLVDSLLKRHTRNRFGWNLIVARKQPFTVEEA
jgi:2-polyprenyl-3-methyl-5-hydroxy-6-metoxy-1,4-benzoquinol methylase